MSMTDKKVFESEFEAWKWIHEMFPDTQWYLDHESSERAGYKTYRDTEEFYNYVCELGDRLEVNLKEGNITINLWIENDDNDPGDIVKEEIYNISFDSTEAIILKAALTSLCNTFTNLDVVDGKYKNTDAAIACLTLVNRIKEVM